MPNRAHSRRDPQKGKNGFSTSKGFTCYRANDYGGRVLASHSLSLALPSYRTLIEKRQVTSTGEQIAAFLSAAKMEAIKRHHDVRIAKGGADDAFCLGFTSYAENTTGVACDCTIDDLTDVNACVVENLDDGSPELRVFDGSRFTKMANLVGISIGGGETDVVSFDPLRGMLTVNDLVVANPLEIQLSSKNDTYRLNVRVSPTGRVTMCSDTGKAKFAVPGYPDCGGV